jgi:hypothetical protein
MAESAVAHALPATPRAWLDTALVAHFDRWTDDVVEGVDAAPTWFTAEELYADDHALLRRLHRRTQVEGEVPARAAAMFLAGWIGGAVAEAVSFALVDARAGVVIDAAQLRWRVQRAGWVDAVTLGGDLPEKPRVLVGQRHPWAAVAGVEVMDEAELLRDTMQAMVWALDPLVAACAGLARVARRGLWNEIADAFGMTHTFDRRRVADDATIALVDQALRSVSGRWRARPSLRVVAGPLLAPAEVVIGQKGGCCLSYTRDLSVRDYCSTCSLRDPHDVCERQLRWHAAQAAAEPKRPGHT